MDGLKLKKGTVFPDPTGKAAWLPVKQLQVQSQ